MPKVRPVTGLTVVRKDTCLPVLSSETRGLDGVPLVTATAPVTMFQPADTWTPVSQVKALTSGTPRCPTRSPTEYADSQPRPRIRTSSSRSAGTLSGRSYVRY